MKRSPFTPPFFQIGCVSLFAFSACAQSGPITLHLDASDAPRQVLRAQLHIPAAPGPLTLVYPKWVPGDHSPDGPITDLTGIKMTASGKTVYWQRDADDMYAFHLEVPAGANAVDVSLDLLLPNSGAYTGGASSSAQLVDISWNQVVLYPKGKKPSEIQFAPSLKLPEGWQFGTALNTTGELSGEHAFAPVSLETLVDSPVAAGRFFRTIDLTPGSPTTHLLDIVADSEGALDIKPKETAALSNLVNQEEAFFASHHYRRYQFLLTLSDHVQHFGLEHHESSDDRRAENFLTDDSEWNVSGALLPHEMVHSWNGKYRRPAGLATPDYQEPMRGELLWVYEGLTDYLGEVMAARAGIWTNETFRGDLALRAAMLDHRAGRSWRALADTTVAAQLLYEARAAGGSWRREVDFYPEGDLIWLEADVIIRQQSHGTKSLEDFCRKFHGGPDTTPKVVPYTFDDVVSTLNETVPYDWRGFFQKRVYEINPRAPLGGIEGSGWRLAYTNAMPEFFKARASSRKTTDLTHSLGFTMKSDGKIVDVIPGTPGALAGLGPDMIVIAVNSRRCTPEILRAAIKSAATNTEPIELLVENADYFKTCKLDYHEGEKYPTLERDFSKPDILSEILKPLPVAGK